jgi:RHS repeat-associated protein
MERDENGVDHTLWRKYESRGGRWTTPDPYGGSMSVGDPQSFNRYAYVGNDPVNLIDPSGLDKKWSKIGKEWRWPPEGTGTREPEFWRSPFLHREVGPAQAPSQAPTPCSEQDLSFNEGSGNYTAEELGAIAQTAVGEASNTFHPSEVEAVIGTIVNRQNINIAAYPGIGPFAKGATQLLSPSKRGTSGILGEYDAHRFESGTKKLNGAKVDGVLPESSYVCDQLKAAKSFARTAGTTSPNAMKLLYPYTSNRGIGASLPSGATGIQTIGDTRFFIDRVVSSFFR